MQNKPIVIIGGGSSSYYIAKGLRNGGYTAPITIVSEEVVLPYNRVLLPRLLRGEIEVDKIFFAQRNWYLENDIQFIPGACIQKSGESFVVSDSWTELDIPDEYVIQRDIDIDKVDSIINNSEVIHIISTGGIAFTPHTLRKRSHHYTWRTLQDTLRIREIMRKASRVAVVGGSYIGVELAMAAEKYGLNFDWIIRGNSFFHKQLVDEYNQYLLNQIPSNNSISIYFETGLQFDDSISRPHIVVDNAVSEYDAIFLGTGVRPSIDIEKGYLKQSDSLYLAGDMVRLQYEGREIHSGSFNQTVRSSKLIVEDILEKHDLFDLESDVVDTLLRTPYQIKFFGVQYRSYGIIDSQLELKTELDDRGKKHQIFLHKDTEVGRIIIS